MEEARFRELSFCDLCLMMVSEEDDEGCMTYYDGGFLFRFAVKCDLRKLGSGSKRFSQMWNSLVRDEEDEEDQDGEMLMLVLTVIAQGWRCRLSFLVDSWWLAWLLTAKLKVGETHWQWLCKAVEATTSARPTIARQSFKSGRVKCQVY
ncbi:hypothetical protein LR48_Vigan03g094700 [Vigna angularis]|uniref:Uncharacterized protein n=1 Tax=Phaseolus angularis TaxID=3914 RepID=A0A0L9U453_PHAAN|nr:hypothetical protein LR48_Vigan03g094700 [Vigna angularis]